MPSTKTREIDLGLSKGIFGVGFKRFNGEKKEYDFDGIATLRQLFSNERARMLSVIKHKNPDSIYSLAKILKRDFKSVSQDIKLLDKFGFIDLIAEHKGKRKRLKPRIAVDVVNIRVKLT